MNVSVLAFRRAVRGYAFSVRNSAVAKPSRCNLECELISDHSSAFNNRELLRLAFSTVALRALNGHVRGRIPRSAMNATDHTAHLEG